MEIITVAKIQRRRRVKKMVMLFFSFVFMACSAYFISISASSNKSLFTILKDAKNNFAKTAYIHTLENCSPVAEYALYSNVGLKSFPNWEVALISGGISRNEEMQKLEFVSNAVKENENAAEASLASEELVIDEDGEVEDSQGEVEVINDDTYFEPDDEGTESETVETSTESSDALASNKTILATLKKTLDVSYLINHFYIVDSSTNIDKSVFNVDKLLKKDCTMEETNKKPQILIFHTHGGSEAFVDSRDGNKADSVVGVGTELAEILSNDYGFNVIHDTTCYDIIDGKIDRNKAYDQAKKGVTKTLTSNPSIEVLIDIHRDSASQGEKKVTTIDGKPTAQIMFFNGLSRNSKGDIEYLKNTNLQGNLAFSLQLKMKAMELYPNLTSKIYLKQYRYNLHLRPKSLLIELGNNMNTVAEAKNAMTPLAKVLNEVLNGD